jgi:hypothetical protein
MVRALSNSIANGFSFTQKKRAEYQGRTWGLMVAEIGTADHGAWRDLTNHWIPAQIILRPVMALPALAGSIITRPCAPASTTGFGILRPQRKSAGPKLACQSVARVDQVLPSSRRAENIFPRHILKWEGSLDAARGSAAAVSSMTELIAMAVGLASAFIFVTHAIEAYRA